VAVTEQPVTNRAVATMNTSGRMATTRERRDIFDTSPVGIVFRF
jgi:hypothetical protein